MDSISTVLPNIWLYSSEYVKAYISEYMTVFRLQVFKCSLQNCSTVDLLA